MRLRHALVGATFLAVVAACAKFGADDVGGSAPDAGTATGSGVVGSDGGDRPDVEDRDAPDADAGGARWCDGGHAFCVDFDDLALGELPTKGWTAATKDSVGATATLTQASVHSAPNAARLELPAGKHTFYFFSQTTEPRGPIKQATLRFAMRPKVGGDQLDTHFTIGSMKLLDDQGLEVGSGDMDWYSTHVTAIGWKGSTGWIQNLWQREAGPLSIDEWLTVVIAFDLTKQSVTFRVQDDTGVNLGETTIGNFNWPEIDAITIELGVWDSDEDRVPLTLLLDDIVLDITR